MAQTFSVSVQVAATFYGRVLQPVSVNLRPFMCPFMRLFNGYYCVYETLILMVLIPTGAVGDSTSTY
jgi:hypothetical protein